MTTHRLARVWKENKRWHWYLILAGPGDASHARVWQGDEPTWKLAMASIAWYDFLRSQRLTSPSDV
jgi:hypothetical protein